MTPLEWLLIAACFVLTAAVIVLAALLQRCHKERNAAKAGERLRLNQPGADLSEVEILRGQLQALTVAAAFLLKRVGFEQRSGKRRAQLALVLGLWLQGLPLPRMAALLGASFATVIRLAKRLSKVVPNEHEAENAGTARVHPIPPTQAGADPDLCRMDPATFREGSMSGAWSEMQEGGGDTISD